MAEQTVQITQTHVIEYDERVIHRANGGAPRSGRHLIHMTLLIMAGILLLAVIIGGIIILSHGDSSKEKKEESKQEKVEKTSEHAPVNITNNFPNQQPTQEKSGKKFVVVTQSQSPNQPNVVQNQNNEWESPLKNLNEKVDANQNANSQRFDKIETNVKDLGDKVNEVNKGVNYLISESQRTDKKTNEMIYQQQKQKVTNNTEE